jgi:hypothetical protein
MASDTDDVGTWRDFYIPIGLLILGVIGRFSQVLAYADGEELTTEKAVVLWLCELMLGSAAMIGGVLGVAFVMSVEFGRPGRAALKLMSLWLIAAVVGCLLAKMDKDPLSVRSMILAFHAVLLVYFFGIAALFKLDLQEALITACVVTGVQGLLLFGIAHSMSPKAARALFFG